MPSPWKTIWSKPKSTIADIVSRNPNEGLWILAFIYGLSGLLNLLQTFLAGSSFPVFSILIPVLLISPVWGYLLISFFSWVVWVTGKWIRGNAEYKAVRASYAWSCVPLAVNILLWLCLALILKQYLFMDISQEVFLTGSQIFLVFLILVARLVFAIWSLVIYINALAEVQGFSILRSIANIVISALLIGVCIYLLLVLAYTFNVIQIDHKTVFHLIEQTVRFQ